MPHADGHYASDAVKIAASGLIPDILHLAFHYHDGLLVEKHQRGREVFPPHGQNLFGAGALIGLGDVVIGGKLGR